MYASVRTCGPCEYIYPWRTEKGVGAPGAGVTGDLIS